MRGWPIAVLVGTACVAMCWAEVADSAVPASRPGVGRVELVRDTWGVAHVFAETDAGAMYGLGYACAEDRAFQMYYNLRIIQGRLAEVVGDRPSARRRESAVFNDRKMRTFGFYRAAKVAAANLDADAKAMLAAYCDGVNDSVAKHRGRLHPLFADLGLEPEPWTPADCIASFWHLGQFFATDGTRELIAYRNRSGTQSQRAVVGRDGRAMTPPEPGPQWVDDEAAVVRKSDVSDEWLGKVESFARNHGLFSGGDPVGGAASPKFSHAWVVGGRKSTTGAAVLVSDPQTPVRLPSIWQEYHVCGKTFNARGVGVPGCPGLLVGWNENVAWGATALGADQADLFRLRTDAEHPDQYWLEGAWRAMEVRHESIRVKAGDPVELVVRETVFGPVITAFAFAGPGDPEVALKRVPVCSADTGTLRAMLGMMRARDVAELRNAFSTWQFPSLNLVYGDRHGDIGYSVLAAEPVRSAEDALRGMAAVEGTRRELDWRGFVPTELLPQVVSPARGWIASANHRPVGSFYPIPLGAGTGNAGHTVRSWRLYERLSGDGPLSPDEVLDIHFDAVNAARRDIVRAGLHLRDKLKLSLSPDALAALAQLEGWYARGARSVLDEQGAAVAGEISTFFRLMTTPLAARYGGGETGLTRFLRDLDARIAKDPAAPLSQDEQDFIDQALAGAWQAAQGRYGPDPIGWPARARQAVTEGRMGAFDTLDGFGSLAPRLDAAIPALTCVDGGTIRSQAGQSYTQFVPLHDVDAAQSLLPPGQSELPDSPWHLSAVELWRKGQLHPAPLSRRAVDRVTTSKTDLGD